MTDTKSSGGVGLIGLLGVLFVGLKLTNVITWSWWWVLAPFWMPVSLLLLLMGVTFCVIAVKEKGLGGIG